MKKILPRLLLCSMLISLLFITQTNAQITPQIPSGAPNPPGPITGPTSVSAPTTSQYSVGAIVPGITLSWRLTPATAGAISFNINQATVTWNGSYTGSATVSCTATNSYGSSVPSTLTVQVTGVPPVITCSIAPASQTCSYNKAPATLTGTVSGGSAYTYQWQSSANNVSWTVISGATGINYIPGALTANTYYQLVATSNGVSATSNTATVIVNPETNPANVDTTFNNAMSHVFGTLNTANIPNGLLRDAGLEFTNLENYNGTALVDSNTLNKHTFLEIYNTLASSMLSADAASTLPGPDAVDSTMIELSAHGQVTLSGLFYQYGYLSSDAVTNGKITVTNNQLYDKYVNGVYQNPYLQAKVVGFAPSYDTYQGKNFNLNLPAALWLSNSKSMVSSISVDAGDGLGYRNIAPGSNLPVSYADTGMKVLNFKVALTDNSVLLSHAQLHIVLEPMTLSAPAGGPNPVLPASHGFAASYVTGPVFDNVYIGASTATYQGKPATGFITIKYATGHTTLVKPLIVVEGFDPGIYTHPTNYTGDFTLNNFLHDYISLSPSSDLINLVNGNTYDIVFIDFSNGTDDIHRNALLVEDAIRWVNASKTGNSPNVVLGLSMGAVISRYALKKMENAGENHQVSEFISHGGPHQGAVVPLGYQYMENHAANLYARSGNSGIYQFVRLLIPKLPNYHGILTLTNTPAAQQMLYYRVNSNFQIDNSVHTAWQSELTALGYPANCRNVAISNGYECGTPQTLPVGGQLLFLDGQLKSSVLTDLVTSGLSLSLNATPAQLATAFLSGLPGRNNILFHFEVYGSADLGGNLVYTGKISYKKTILGTIPIYITLTNKSYNSPSGTYPLESFEGDYYQITSPLSSSTSSNDPIKSFFAKYNITASQFDHFGFIPTTSALDIGKSSTVLAETDYQASYSGANPPLAPKNSPFNSFVTAHYSSLANEEHITYNDGHISNWLANELHGYQYTTIGCTLFCNMSIAGNDNDCNNLNTYSVPYYSNVTYQWSIGYPSTQYIQIIGSANGSTVQVQPISGNIGKQGVLTLNIYTPDCGTITVTKTITIGIEPLAVSSVVDRTPQASHYQYLTATANQLGNTSASNYNWYLLVNNQPTTLIGTGLQLRNYPIAPCTTIYYQCQVTTACGVSTYNGYAYNTYCGSGSAMSQSVIAYPNPADNTLTVTNYDIQTNQSTVDGSVVSNSSAIPQAYEIRLYNNKGQILRSGANQNGNPDIVIGTTDISNGTYYLHIIRGSDVIEKQIVIQH